MYVLWFSFWVSRRCLDRMGFEIANLWSPSGISNGQWIWQMVCEFNYRFDEVNHFGMQQESSLCPMGGSGQFCTATFWDRMLRTLWSWTALDSYLLASDFEDPLESSPRRGWREDVSHACPQLDSWFLGLESSVKPHTARCLSSGRCMKSLGGHRHSSRLCWGYVSRAARSGYQVPEGREENECTSTGSVPSWDLNVVLEGLRRAPFKPLGDASLALCWWKWLFHWHLPSSKG